MSTSLGLSVSDYSRNKLETTNNHVMRFQFVTVLLSRFCEARHNNIHIVMLLITE